jgi:hypothetical protein
MTLDPAKGALVVAAYLDDVDGELEAVRRLVATRQIASQRFISSKLPRSWSRRFD